MFGFYKGSGSNKVIIFQFKVQVSHVVPKFSTSSPFLGVSTKRGETRVGSSVLAPVHTASAPPPPIELTIQPPISWDGQLGWLGPSTCQKTVPLPTCVVLWYERVPIPKSLSFDGNKHICLATCKALR